MLHPRDHHKITFCPQICTQHTILPTHLLCGVYNRGLYSRAAYVLHSQPKKGGFYSRVAYIQERLFYQTTITMSLWFIAGQQYREDPPPPPPRRLRLHCLQCARILLFWLHNQNFSFLSHFSNLLNIIAKSEFYVHSATFKGYCIQEMSLLSKVGHV